MIAKKSYDRRLQMIIIAIILYIVIIIIVIKPRLRCPRHLQVRTVMTIEDFWALYNHIIPASRIPMANDYSFFKQGRDTLEHSSLSTYF